MLFPGSGNVNESAGRRGHSRNRGRSRRWSLPYPAPAPAPVPAPGPSPCPNSSASPPLSRAPPPPGNPDPCKKHTRAEGWMVSHYDRRSAKNGHRLHNGHDDGDTRSRSRSDSRGSSRSRGRSRRWRVAPTPAPTSVPAPSPAPCPSSCTAPPPFQRAPPRKLRQVLAACHLRCHAASPVSGSAQAGGARDRRRFCRPGQIECRPPATAATADNARGGAVASGSEEPNQNVPQMDVVDAPDAAAATATARAPMCVP